MLVQIEGMKSNPRARLPEWLRKPGRNVEADHELKRMLRTRNLHTVCEEARCPNRNDCFARGAATFMILGDTCSRSCGFCAVKTGRGASLESLAGEPDEVAEAASQLGLRYVVITSVNRDELPDGGAGHFAKTIHAVRSRLPESLIEVLTPDFKGNREALHAVLDARPDTFNHNVESVPRLYPKVRPQADYQQSLDLLRNANRYAPGILTKSGFMVGLGERKQEVRQLLEDLRAHDVGVVTIGQYLQPTRKHLAVEEYLHPDVFQEYKEYGEGLGFRAVFSGPLVRSSYMAEMVHEQTRAEDLNDGFEVFSANKFMTDCPSLIADEKTFRLRHTEEAMPPAFSRDDLLARRLRVAKVLPYQQSTPPFISNLSLALFSGLLLIFAFPEWNLWSLGWVGTAPLIMAVAREQRFWPSMLLGYVTGTLFYMGSSHWVTHTFNVYGEIPLFLSYLILLAFASLLGLFTGLFAAALGRLINRFGGWAMLAAPALWAASEWARIQTVGMGWNALGYSQAFQQPVIQIARLGGVYIVSALLVSASTALVFALIYLERRRGIIVLTAAGVLAGATLAYGQAIRPEADEPHSVSVVAVQPDIPISGPWDDPNFIDRMTTQHLTLSEEAIRGKGNPPGAAAPGKNFAPTEGPIENRENKGAGVDLVIWPESPMNYAYDRDEGLRGRLGEFARRNQVYLLISSWGFPVGAETDDISYNSAILIGPTGEKISEYDKIALVPFGEYVPARSWIPFMDRVPALIYDIAPGKNLILSDVAGAKLGTLICFEATRPDIARRERLMGASVFAQISNELWYNSAAAARQMLAEAVFRAVENNTELIRVTNSGLSARIDRYGNTYDETEMFEIATRRWKAKTVAEAGGDGLTFYTRYGDLFAIACTAISLLLVAATFIPKKEKSEE